MEDRHETFAHLVSALAALIAAQRRRIGACVNYPNQTVRIVVPFSAGSITDGLARILADKLCDIWKQQVIVENRPGLPGTTSVAKAAPDGYTLMLTSNGHTIAGVINKSLQFDPVKDFAGVSQVASVPLVVIVPPDLPAKTLKEFIALAKQKPGQLNFSSAGVASTSFLSAEIFRQNARINIVHVPFKGAPEAVTAVVRGDVQMYFAPIPAAQELSAAGKVRAIAINSAKRVPQLPDVPTVAEAGGAGLSSTTVLVRRAGAGRHAASDPQQGQPGHRQGAGDARRGERSCTSRGRFPRPTRRSSSTPSSRATPSATARSCVMRGWARISVGRAKTLHRRRNTT